MKIPESTETGKQFRLRGKGMPVLRSTLTGDLYVQVEVETPQNLTRKQKELLKEFEKASTETTNPGLSGFAQRVKEFWERMGNVACWNTLMDENRYMIRKWNEFIAS